jgi:hypothetical protein
MRKITQNMQFYLMVATVLLVYSMPAAAKSETAEIEVIDEHIDHAHRIVFVDVIFQLFGK